MARSPLGFVFALSSMHVILASRGVPQMQASARHQPRFRIDTSIRHPSVINGCRRYTPSHLFNLREHSSTSNVE
jgi:hypothetical protein